MIDVMGARNRMERRQNRRLSDELTRQGRSLNWFCKQMDVSRWTFWRIESGIVGAPLGWYSMAAHVLGVSVEDIAPEVEVAA